MIHPRLRHYPRHAEYVALANEFRPFVMFTHTPNYRSGSVNTDGFGLRENYDAEGRYVDLRRAKGQYGSCNLLVGGSTAFGVDAGSDQSTIAFLLNRPGRPCLNLGIRGAVSHQELQAYLLLRRYLPAVRDVVVLSGVNLAALASLEDAVFYPEFGGIFSEGWHYDTFRDQYQMFSRDRQGTSRRRALESVDRWFRESRLGAAAARWIAGRQPVRNPPPAMPRMGFEEKVALLEDQFAQDLDVWACLQRHQGVRVHYVLQPVMNWCGKRPARIEAACLDADLRTVPSIGKYANADFYRGYRGRVAAACRDRGLAFHDANDWFGDAGPADQELFTDVCHLTDGGNARLAGHLDASLDWTP